VADHDNGVTSQIEEALISVLAAQTKGDPPENVFKTVDYWRYQVDQAGSGAESFQRFAPFAFVKYQPPHPNRLPFFENDPPRPGRVGDFDMLITFRFVVFLGVYSRVPGDNRIGNSTSFGISKIRDIVISALDNFHLVGVACDDLYYTGEKVLIENPTCYGLEMYFDTR